MSAPSNAVTPIAPAAISRVRLSGVRSGKPNLHFKLTAATRSTIESLVITQPNGFSFTHDRKELKQGISILGTGSRSLKVRHGTLTITLKHRRAAIPVWIDPTAASESCGLRHRAEAVHAYNKSKRHRHKRTVKLTWHVQLPASSGYPKQKLTLSTTLR
jgi:hypothetical protein